MLVCHRCGKENQDHYKFCLGCGAELTSPSAKPQGEDMGMMKTMLADVGAPSPSATPKQPIGQINPSIAAGAPLSAPPAGPPPAGPPPAGPPPGVPIANVAAPFADSPGTAVGMPPGDPGWNPEPATPVIVTPASATPASATPAAPAGAAPQSVTGPRMCPSCNSEIPPAFKFCGVCGFRMPDEPAPAPAAVIQPEPPSAIAVMTLIRPDGTEGGTHQLHEGVNKIGRNHGTIFENDGYLSPTHALLTVDSATHSATIEDLDSLNGVFVRMTREEEITPGQIIRIGQELLRFDTIERPEPMEDGTEVMGSPNPGYWGKLTVVIGMDVDGSSYPLLGDSVTLGRERGEINFPDDGYVSGLHAKLSNQGERLVLEDLGSSNGTFVKISDIRSLVSSDFVLLGQQLFRLTL